jgi:O-antigen/teichoic acid export membrane protein
MNRIKALWGKLKRDNTLGRVIKNSGYLFLSNIISAVISIATANLLGVEQFGALGIIISFVSNINRLLSFRMSDVVVRYMGEYVAKKEYERAAAIVKAAGLTEGITSLLAYAVLAVLSPLGARYIAHDPATTPLFFLYGITIISMLTTETATGVLQVGNFYLSQSVVNLLQSVVTAIVIVYAYLAHAGIMVVLLAYLAGKIIAGVGPILLALIRMPRIVGPRWWKASFKLLPPFKELSHFALSTNFSGTINMVVRDSEILWVGGFFSATVAGYFKVALAIINLIIMPINPFIATTYPEIIRTMAKKMWLHVRSLLKRVTFIAGLWTTTVAIVLLAAGKFLLFTPWIPWHGHLAAVYKPEYLPSYPILLILLIGFGIGNTVYWSRSLLLAFGRPDYALKVSFWGSLAKVGLTVGIIPLMVRNGMESSAMLVEAGLFTCYLLVTVGILTWKGLSLVQRNLQEGGQ